MKVLIAGLGGIGQRHVRNLRALLGDELDLLAYRVRRLSHVVTPRLDIDPGKDVEREYGIRTYTELETALAERPDIAVIANPSSMHVETAMACARGGCDLFIEKPLSNSLAGVESLIEAVDRQQRIAMVGYQLRFHPCLKRFAEVVRSGALGHLLSVRATVGEYLPNWHRYEDYRTMYAARADQGGGVVLSQIHEFDYLYSLFGRPDRLYAIGGRWSDLDIDVEDTASVLMQFVVGGRPLPVHLHQDYLQRPPSRQCELIGDKGKAVMDLAALTVTVWDSANAEPSVDCFDGFDRNHLFIDETQHFLACVKNRERPVVDLHDGLESLKMAIAAKRSIATGQVVDFGGDRDVGISA